jgi:predicted CXXCH cytochrome family protein
MSRGNWLVCAASVTLLLSLVVRANSPQDLKTFDLRQGSGGQAGPQNAKTSKPQDLGTTSEYLGSASCEKCHQADYAGWKNSLHIKMTRPVAEATIAGDFRDGTKFADHDRSYQFGIKDGKPWISIAFGGNAPETFTVEYTLGAKRFQGYLAKLPEGRIFVLPVFWHVTTKRWVDWKEITPIPDGAHGIRQIWNSNCFNCHATNIVQGYDINDKAYKSTWTEMGIGCEACHGPGRPHVELMEAWEKDPASKPNYDNSASNRQLSTVLKTLSYKSAEPRRVYDTCAYCHGNKRNAFVGFKAGDRYEDYATPFVVSEPIPDNDLQGEFWPDGRPNRFNRSQALALSGCFNAGAITCTNCHLAHGSPNEYSLKVNINDGAHGDELCTQCHTAPKTGNREPAAGIRLAFTGAGLQGHTFHAPQSEGSRCISCHMSDANWRLLIRRRDHTFQPPVPENTAQFGIPNACTSCHDDRSPEWAARQMNEWWGDAARRSKSAWLAGVMYRAGSGDGSTLPDLAKIAIDRSQGFIVRAGAADYIGRLVSESRSRQQAGATAQSQTSFVGLSKPRTGRKPVLVDVTPSIVNALIGAANDPEPVVRAAAVNALGTIGDRQRSLAPILARLVDQTRVVRAKAAEVLASFGVVQLPGPAGEALTKAQDEYILSLDTFPDSASNHAAKGWLEAERGNVVSARDALNKATQVEPNQAFAWVVKGVLMAREGKFAEAVEMWKKARSIEPSYPNIDQLIAEAEKRK